MNSQSKYVIGVDYGTDSCREIIADVKTGEEVSAAISYYPRWKEGKYCDPLKNQYRQHPLDYIETLEAVIKEAVHKAIASKLDGKTIVKEIYVKNRIYNIVVK